MNKAGLTASDIERLVFVGGLQITSLFATKYLLSLGSLVALKLTR